MTTKATGKPTGKPTGKRAGYAAAGVAAAVLVLSGLPALIQWNGYKSQVVAAAQARLGRDLFIDGPLSVALLPLPHVVAHDVRLAGLAEDGAAAPEMLTARELDLRPALLPLLSGRFQLASLRLSGAELHLRRLKDGRANWRFQPAARMPAKPDAVASPAGPAESAVADSAPPRPPLPAVSLENSLVTYQAGGASPLRLEGVSAALSQESGGAIRFAAKGDLHGAVLSAQGRLQDEQLALTLSLGGRAEAQADFTGAVSAGDGLKGRLRIKGEKLNGVASALGWRDPRLPQGGMTLDGELTVKGSVLRFDKASLSLAGADGIASVDADFGHGPQFDVALAFNHVDLDRWAATLPVSALRQAVSAEAPPVPAKTPETGAPPVVREKGGGFSKALTVNLDLSIDSLSLHGGVLRQARLNAALADGELLVNQAGVELPGQSELDLFGFFTPDDGGVAFDGTLEGRSSDMRGLLAWLDLPPAHLARDRLKQGSFTGHVLADGKSMRLEDGVVKLDDARADLAADLKLGRRPALGLSFSLDRLDLDAYRAATNADSVGASSLPESAAPVPEKGGDQGAPANQEAKAEGVVPPPAGGKGWLEGIDANLKGKVGALTAYGLTAHDLSVDAGWLDGVLTLKDLSSADVDGAQLSLDGGLDPDQRAFRNFHWALRSDHPERVLNALVRNLPVAPDRLAPLALTGTLDGRLDDTLKLDSRNEIAGGQLDLRGTIGHPLDAPSLQLSLAASHASLTQVVRLFSPDYRPQASLGDFAVSAAIAGPLADLAVSDLRLKLGPAAMAGEARLKQGGVRPRLELKLTAGEIPIDPFLPTKRTGDAWPTLREQIENGLLIPTKGVPARRSGGDSPPPPASAPRPKVTVSGLSDHWPSDPLPLSWLSSLDGHAAIEAQAVTWGRNRLDQASLGLDVQDGAAGLEHLGGKLWGGDLTLSGALADNGALKLDGRLVHAQMRDALLSTADLGMADGLLDGEAALTAKGRSVNEMVSHLNGTLGISVTNGLIKGFDLKAVDDKARETTNPLGLINLIQAGLTGGSTRFSSLGGTARIKDGILVCDDLALVADGGGAKGQISANLPGWVMDSRIAFHLASSPEAPPLVMRLTGSLDNPRRFLDINAMQGWLAQKGVVLKGPMKDAADALGKMVNGERKADGGKVKAKDVLKGFLKGLK